MIHVILVCKLYTFLPVTHWQSAGLVVGPFYPSATRWGCQVCVICISKGFHSFIFKLCIIIVHTLNMCVFYFVHISGIISHFGVLSSEILSVRNASISPSAKILEFLVCVIVPSKMSGFCNL